MTDTSPEIERKYEELLMQKSPEERLRMGCSMFSAARKIVVSSLAQRNVRRSRAELRRQIFLRFYGEDFTGAAKEKILAGL
jgi:hypothetical protein